MAQVWASTVGYQFACGCCFAIFSLVVSCFGSRKGDTAHKVYSQPEFSRTSALRRVFHTVIWTNMEVEDSWYCMTPKKNNRTNKQKSNVFRVLLHIPHWSLVNHRHLLVVCERWNIDIFELKGCHVDTMWPRDILDLLRFRSVTSDMVKPLKTRRRTNA